MKTFKLIPLLAIFTVSAAFAFTQSKLSYAKHKEISGFEIEGYTKIYTKLIDSVKMTGSSYNKYLRGSRISNNYEVNIVVTWGSVSATKSAKGDLAKFKANPSGLLRPIGANKEANTIDSMWVVIIEGKKVVMNYYYCCFKNAEGEFKMLANMVAFYDDGFDKVCADIQPTFCRDSGLAKFENEPSFKARLVPVAELEAEVTKAMKQFIGKI